LQDIPEIVKEFITKYIRSIDVLEILLLLRQEPEKEWPALTVSKTAMLDLASVEARLEHLSSVKLITARVEAEESVYRYAPSTPHVAAAIEQLAKLYSSHRVSIVSLVFSGPIDRVDAYPRVAKTPRDYENK
jgi:hypothetical protein